MSDETYWCEVCEEPIEGKDVHDRHTTLRGEDCHAGCCLECNGPLNDDHIQANLERAAFAGRPQTTSEMMLEDIALDGGFPL